MKIKKAFICSLAALFILITVSSCGRDSENVNDTEPDYIQRETFAETEQQSTTPSNDESAPTDSSDSFSEDFSFSEDLDENGFWRGVTILDHVELFNYQALHIPAEVHQISQESIQEIVDNMLASEEFFVRVADRPVVSGDRINIDFVGSVDGEEFEGGSTMEMGMYVTAGSSEFIGDFLHQLIGHMPGSVVNVEVAFPDDYFEPSLAGAEALFITTINYIEEPPELTDEFVAENFSHINNIATVEELYEDIREFLQSNAIMQYINRHIDTQTVVRSFPQPVTRHFEQAILLDYAQQAMQFGMDLNALLDMQGFDSIEEFVEEIRDEIEFEARRSLALQAVAEDAGITTGIQDVTDFFIENFHTEDFSMFEEMYGLPWLKQFIRNERVLDYIREHAVLG